MALIQSIESLWFTQLYVYMYIRMYVHLSSITLARKHMNYSLSISCRSWFHSLWMFFFSTRLVRIDDDPATYLSGWWFGTFLFSHILGIIIPIDYYFSAGLKPPTRYQYETSDSADQRLRGRRPVKTSSLNWLPHPQQCTCWCNEAAWHEITQAGAVQKPLIQLPEMPVLSAKRAPCMKCIIF